MNSYEFNVAQLTSVAKALDDLLPQVIFVGGCTTALLVDQSAHFGVRQTMDVDVIIDVTIYTEYQKFSRELRKKGFREDIDGPNCRWLLKSNTTDIQLDVMPIDEKVLGFSNRWYPDAIKNTFRYPLNSNVEISVVSPVYFLATKFEAFANRGDGNFFSHDIEDIVFVLENRATILNEILGASLELKNYLADRMKELQNDNFLNVLPGILNSGDSANAIEDMLKIITKRPWLD